ncbi:uncharacterized protein [Epargyreus clarus]|uniref:uncharacterized protein n=1 Tax=Epargyreus clarus TaxID=520877 RepID=UPI003C2E83EC
MEQTLNHGMCRCCASEGMFKNFSATYQWMGADEVYADMLKECFDISLTTADDWNNGGICEVCITQLRNASNFRKQVLQTEDQFKKALQDKLYKDSIVKVEVNRDEDDLDSDNNVSDFSGTGELEFEVPVKEELEETKTKKRTAKATTSRAKKAKTEDGEPSSKRGRRTDSKDEDIILDELTTEIRNDVDDKEQNEKDDVIIETEDDPLAMEAHANENTRQTIIDNVTKIFRQNVGNDDNEEVESNRSDNLNKLSVEQNHSNKKDTEQNIVDTPKSVCSRPKEKNDTTNKTAEAKKQDDSKSSKQKKEDNIKQDKLQNSTKVTKTLAKYEINSNVSVDNIIETNRSTRTRYNLRVKVPKKVDLYNNDDQEKVKKCQPIKRRRFTVFTPKVDLEVGNRVSTRRKSVEFGLLNDQNEIHKTDQIQMFKQKDNNDKQSTPKLQSNVKNVVPEQNKLNDVVIAQTNEKYTSPSSSYNDDKYDEQSTPKRQSNVKNVVPEQNKVNDVVNAQTNENFIFSSSSSNDDKYDKQDTKIINKKVMKQKYKDYDIFKGPTKNWREKREAEMNLIKIRGGLQKALNIQDTPVNVTIIPPSELKLSNQKAVLTSMKNRRTELEKTVLKETGKSVTTDPIKQTSINKINNKNISKKNDESTIKDLNTNTDHEENEREMSLENKVRKMVSFHPDIVTCSQTYKSVDSDDTDDNNGPGRNKSIMEYSINSSRENKQNKTDENQNKGSDEDKSLTDYPNKSSRDNKSVTDCQSKSSRENKRNSDDNQQKESRNIKISTSSKDNNQNNADETNHNKESTENKSSSDYANESSRIEQNESLTELRRRSIIELVTGNDNDSNTLSLRNFRKTKKAIGTQNKVTDNDRSEHLVANYVPVDVDTHSQHVLDDSKNKSTGNNNVYNNQESIQLETSEKDETINKSSHRRTLLGDLKQKYIMESTNRSRDDKYTISAPFTCNLPDDLRSKKDNNISGNVFIFGQYKSSSRYTRLVDDIKYKSKEKPYKDIFYPFRDEENNIFENLDVSSNDVRSKEKEYQDIFGDSLRPENDVSLDNIDSSDDDLSTTENVECLECNEFSTKGQLDDRNKIDRDSYEKYSGTGEILSQKRKIRNSNIGDSNIFEDKSLQEKSVSSIDQKLKHRRYSTDNKNSGCESFDDPRNKDSREKDKTDSRNKHYKQRKDSVDEKSSREKIKEKVLKGKKDHGSVSDKHSKRREDKKSEYKSSLSSSSKNNSAEEDKKKRKGLIEDVSEKRIKDKSIRTDDCKYGNMKDVNKNINSREAVKRKSVENIEDMNDQRSSHANSDVIPSTLKRAKIDKEKSTKDTQSEFDELLNNDSEQSSDEEDFKAKVLKARALKSGKLAPRNQLDFHKHVHNIKTIMRWTNATPIRRFSGDGYECAFCDADCRKPAGLKTHTLETHQNFSEAYFVINVDMASFCVKLDITDLECYICSTKIHDVNAVMNHLHIEHKKKMFRDVKNHVVPFKFDNDSDTLTCFMCNSRHSKFKTLLEHTITKHCRNYVCIECNVGFVNEKSLEFHSKIHVKSTLKADYTFDSLTKMSSHEKSTSNQRSKFTRSGEPDTAAGQRELQPVKVYNTDQPRKVCNTCDLVFDTRADYFTHMKREHLLGQDHKCTECQRKFLKLEDLKQHRLTHTFEKFQCNVCSKIFNTKDLLIKHLQAHNDERPYICSICPKVFARKGTLRTHMSDLHDINIDTLRPHACQTDTNSNLSSVGLNALAPDPLKFEVDRCCAAIEISIVSIVTTDVDSISGPAVILFKERPEQRMRKAKRTGKKDNEKATNSESKEIISKVDLGMNTRKYNSRREGGSELQKHLANIKEILQWSNATPIRCRGGIGYACCYCSEQFPNPADLKSHTLLSHVGIANACFTKKRDMTGFVLKVDITNLRCKICAKDIDNLDNLMEHLIKEHMIKLYTDIKSHMLQFKFNGDQLRCFICLNEYHRFKMLLEHMSGVHNRNFICDICDAGFVNLRKLVTHSTGHNTGTFKCSYCDKVFMTLKKQKSHEICVHTRPKGNRCGYCKETFKVHAQKERHLVEVHGAQIPTFKCSACDKEFTTRRSYNVHTRRDHLMERKHACKECDMKFFCSSDLRDHMHKHTGIKNFECKICLKTYSRRSTLREHLRIHADDRKYKCEMCGMTFIQRCSWRVHVRAKHGEHV